MLTVYTAIFGRYDTLKEPTSRCDGTSFVCFCDELLESLPDSRWELRRVPRRFMDPCRDARMFKLLSHMFIDTDVSMWIDGSFELIGDVTRTVCLSALNGADLACHKHDTRDCVYEEAAEVIRLGRADSDIVARQIAEYSAIGLPEHEGMISSGILIRNRSTTLEEFERRWWAELCAGSRRDQISFPYAYRMSSIKVTWLPNTVYQDPMARHHKHHG